MKSKATILKEAHQRINDHLMVSSWWRAFEVRDNYNLVEGDQWLEKNISDQLQNGMPTRTINKLSPAVAAISGFQIQNRSDVDYIPRKVDAEEKGFTDMVGDAVRYMEYTAQTPFHNSQAFRDMLICGMGAVDRNISYDNNPDGDTVDERIFPYLTLWDVAARAKNLKDANWVMRAKVVDQDVADTLIKNADDIEEVDGEFTSTVDARFLDFFNVVMVTKSLSVIYEYQWRDKVTFYRVENPLQGFEGDPEDEYVQQLVELARTLQDKYTFNAFEDKVFSIDKEDHAKVKDSFEVLGLKFKAVKQKKFKYYRATIIGNKVLDAEENFSQTGFSIKFMTGLFSEVRQCYYGVIRGSKEAQRLLNQTVSDYEGYLRTIPKGGVNIEEDAVPNMKAFIDTYAKAREVTIYRKGALMNGKVQSKIAPPIPQGMMEMIQMASANIMETIGITPDFMGISDSKLMTAQLNSQLVRQGLTVLAPYFDALKFFTIDQGILAIDCVRIMAENSEGRLIRVIDKGESKYIPLLKDNIAAHYDVIVNDVPETPDQRQEMFTKLSELAVALLQLPQPVNIVPMALEYSDLKESQIEEIKQQMAPPPPPQPDPITQNLLIAETKAKEASAEKLIQDSMKVRMDMLLKHKELEDSDKFAAAELKKIISDTHLNDARAFKELHNNQK